ncbi:hypothetical protein SSP24_82030 [Streptomyces spinoverrucosus]|uniref:ATP-grasp domain-containing protein n=2 Tax=Streptomyces spinoverrucosus TaxID=284043 RepID=A0A4Y3VWD2_9ACTN|nr:hypothetical protein SSP24_82030 [Streptomyces spinoverrucosus]GHB98799.1 hypothetical protein GCM10010397_83930 [Streptomyces spinoverrucosus]
MTEVFQERGWKCYWVTFDDIDVASLHHSRVYDVSEQKFLRLNTIELNARVDVVLARVMGSVEGKIGNVREYFERLQEEFHGVTLNDPASVLYGLRKDYLFEYAKAGFATIPTEYFDRTVSFAELERVHRGQLDRYVIKPVTGELGNSFASLASIDEGVLRHKEPLVGGWLVQPFMPSIWEGEYQLFFIGNTLVQGIRKVHRKVPGIAVPQPTDRSFEKHQPTPAEEAFARRAKAFWTGDLGRPIDICRVDFIKDTDGSPLLLEFEAVNPGFLFNPASEARRVASLLEEHAVSRIHHA